MRTHRPACRSASSISCLVVCSCSWSDEIRSDISRSRVWYDETTERDSSSARVSSRISSSLSRMLSVRSRTDA